MRIGIDVRYLSHGLMGGVHTYVENFVPALLAQADGHEVYLYADTKCPLELGDLPKDKRIVVRNVPWRTSLSSLYHDLFYLGKIMENDRLDIAHFPANYGFGPSNARTVITLHDAINVMPWQKIIEGHPKNIRTISKMTYLHWCSTAAVRRAKMLITVSEYARTQIARYTQIDPQRIVPIHHAPTPDLKCVTDAATIATTRQRYQLDKPFILADALKNPAVIVRAWRLLPDHLRASYQIVFFSRRPDPLPIVHQAVEDGAARLLIAPSRQELGVLYSCAEAFVFPSWIEGFGIPILEAMTCGAPVIASNRGAIPEVAGEAALLMDAEDETALARFLKLILTEPPQAHQLRQKGFERASQFSWRNTASRILETYQFAMTI